MNDERRAWMRVMSLCAYDDLVQFVGSIGSLPPFEYVREPEVGLTMIRGRVGGSGAVFNLGEMTVTRCRVQVSTEDGARLDGVACVAGRANKHAAVAALCDALLQSERWHDEIERAVLAPARRSIIERRVQLAEQRAATKADFVTVVRSGES